MIGLGSNRLSVCRRGGMSVTQAGRGGMEWLAGGRMPIWASPYSAQATAALKAQFPTQWPTIRDYGFAHPEIVGYMNAYAPEDAKIAYSLVEGIGTRTLNSNDSGAYARIPFHAGVVVDNSKAVIKSKITLKKNGQLYSTDCSYGNNLRSAFGIAIMNNALKCNIVGGQAMATLPGELGTTVNIVNAWNYIDVDGVRTNKTGHLDWNDQYIWIFYGANPSYVSNLSGGDMCSITLEYDGADVITIVPFIRSGQKGFLDILSNTFYPNIAGTGDFYISETPAS